MADIPQYGGLDPSITSYVQGGGVLPVVPTSPPVQALQTPDAQPTYGLPAPVFANVQNGSPPYQPPLPTDNSAPAAAPPQFGSSSPPAPNAIPDQAPTPTALPSAALSDDLASASAQAAPAQPAQSSPDYSAGTANVPTTPAEVAKSNQVYAKQQAAQAAFDASPEGIYQKAYAQHLAALNKSRQDSMDADAAEAAKNDAIAKVTTTSGDRQAQQEKIDAAQRATDQATIAKNSQDYAQKIKDAADYHVNTNRDIGVGGMIAIALSGIGDALDHRHGPNAALQIINDSIDKRIADQWAQKKALGEAASDSKSVLDVSRQDAAGRREDQDVTKAALLTDAKNQIANIVAQSANPELKTRGEMMQTKISQQIGDLTTGLAQHKFEVQKTVQDEADKKAQLGVAYGHLALAQQSQKDQKAENDRDFALKVAELDASGQKAQAAALKDQADEVSERGMFVPTGVNPDGSIHRDPVMQENGTAWVAPKGKADEDLGNIKAATIDGVKQMDDMRKLRSQFTTADQFANWATTTEDGRKLLQKQAKVILDLHEASGINRFSGEVVDLSKKILTGGADITSAKSLLGELDGAREMMIDGLDASMRGKGNYTGKPMSTYFPDPLKAKATIPLGEQLTQPSGKAQGPGVLDNYDSLRGARDAAPPQTNAPGIINNFGRAPGAPTVPETPRTWHEQVVDMLHRPKK